MSDLVEAIGLFDVTRSGAGVKVSARRRATTAKKAAAAKKAGVKKLEP